MALELFKIKEGKLLIAFADEKLSVGTLELAPGKELPKHNCPAVESLIQLEGETVIKLFEGEKIAAQVKLKEGDSIEMKPNQWHIHSNPSKSKKSITFWKLEGNALGVIEAIRKNNVQVSGRHY
jgi:quercetin dioxygenase-like cupin family protein